MSSLTQHKLFNKFLRSKPTDLQTILLRFSRFSNITLEWNPSHQQCTKNRRSKAVNKIWPSLLLILSSLLLRETERVKSFSLKNSVHLIHLIRDLKKWSRHNKLNTLWERSPLLTQLSPQLIFSKITQTKLKKRLPSCRMLWIRSSL